MFGWLTSEERQLASDPALSQIQHFLSEYAASDQKDLYALHLWGVVNAFKQIFGGLGGYHASSIERKKKYISLLGTTAINSVQEGELISASCHNAFMNYIVATKDIPREKHRGKLEQISDIIDGIVRLGQKKSEEIENIEKAAHEFINGPHKIGSGYVDGPVTERSVVEVSKIILSDLRGVLHTGDDFYWFVVEQHDRLVSLPSAIRDMLDGLPLFPIEYRGRRSSESYVGKPNPGVVYLDCIRPEIHFWCTVTVPNLEPNELTTRVIAAAYGHFRQNWHRTLDGLRLEMAKQYREDCSARGDSGSAAQWDEVIAHLS